MDRSWIDKPAKSKEFVDGFAHFLDFAFEKSAWEGKIYCPCKGCCNRKYKVRNDVAQDVFRKGFLQGYTKWIFHGELMIEDHNNIHSSSDMSCGEGSTQIENQTGNQNMRDLVRDAFGMVGEINMNVSMRNLEGHEESNIEPPSHGGCSENYAQYHKLMEDCDEELYPGCANYSKLSFILQLFHIKSTFGWSGKSFTMLLSLLISAFPQISSFPSSLYEAKRMLKDLGLGYEKIDACPNDCILYWGERENAVSCDVCGSSRWVSNTGDNSDQNQDIEIEEQKKKKKKSAKVLRYFSLIPRLKRLYMSSKTASDMTWHHNNRVDDGTLRHPADAKAWKAFDARYPEFASCPRNIRLGLATDGFNPYGTLSASYSIWPVILFPYNLPPWLCMKQSSLIMSMIIPGQKSPGNDIDVYLQPLIAELKQLWEGVDAYDIVSGANFKLRAALMWTINDFPAYANMSGWSTKGRYACPCCAKATQSVWLKKERKFCYMGHRRWLHDDHPFRSSSGHFDGIETRKTPTRASGINVIREMETSSFQYGKSSKSSKKRVKELVGTSSVTQNIDVPIEEDPIDAGGLDDAYINLENQQLWKKRSIFFDLPYWKYHLLCHNLDVMHIEKNVCDNLVGFLLDPSKYKDTQMDLMRMGTRDDLHPNEEANNTIHYPVTSYTMRPDNKERFLTVLKNLKVPDGYASNISRCVNLKQGRLMNLKSHDCHVLIQDLLPIALRTSVESDEVVELMSQLSAFFKTICAKELDVNVLEDVQSKVVITLCRMEKAFPPGFFTIMVHLIVHLVEEVILGGPVSYRWMYPIERAWLSLKSSVGNRSHPEGSIAEGMVAKECLIFCSRYFEGVETIFNRLIRNEEEVLDLDRYLHKTGGRPIAKVQAIILDQKSLAQAHRYVLLQCDRIDPYRRDFIDQKIRETGKYMPSEALQTQWLVKEFSDWLQKKVPIIDASTSDGKMVKALARGPNDVVKEMKGFIINGYRFHTYHHDTDRFHKTQNFGVTVVTSDSKAWFGRILGIYELDYFGDFKCVLFRCDWVDVNTARGMKQDRRGFTLLNFSRLIHTGKALKDDPFVLSSQVRQVFYVEDGKDKGWFHVVKTKPRNTFALGEKKIDDDEGSYPECIPLESFTD